MRLFVPRERAAGETRVAATPETVEKAAAAGFEVSVETGAGTAAHFEDGDYETAGATLASGGPEAWRSADVIVKVAPPADGTNGRSEVDDLREGSVLIGLLDPYRNLEMVRRLAVGGCSAVAMELIPRITRAQSMDALSSQASIAGYKAAVLAAGQLDRYFPLLMTAAGTIPPARVVVMGGGVAGLQALATCKRLGAVVEVSDIRPAVQQEVESLGGRFIPLPLEEETEGGGGYAKQMGEEFLRRQREIVKEHLSHADVAITTAQVPGKRAPMLISKEMVEAMRPGALIIDIAAEQGGNCEVTRAGEEVVHAGVNVIGARNLPAEMPHDASVLYARNVWTLLAHMQSISEEGRLEIVEEDEILGPCLVTHGGRVANPALDELLAKGES